MRLPYVAPIVFTTLAIAGCGSGSGLRIETQATSSLRPSAVSKTAPVDPATGEIGSGFGCRALPRAARRRLGEVTYLRVDAIRVTSLASCRTRTLVPRGADGPLRFSPSGRWIAYGRGTVVSADGRSILRPLGAKAVDWTWVAHHDDLLVGVTAAGGVVSGRPGQTPRRSQPDGWGAFGVVADQDGSRLAIARGSDRRNRDAQIWTADPDDPGRPRLAYRLPNATAAVQVAGFTPGGQILFWPNRLGSASLEADGLPLQALAPRLHRVTTVTTSMLLNRDWIARCGQRVALTVGGDRRANLDKALALSEPPNVRVVANLAGGSRSWISPDCTPDGHIIVAAAGPNRDEHSFGDERRSIWSVSPESARRVRLTPSPPTHISDEDPRVSPDGKWVMFVRSGPLRRERLPGRLYLASITGTRLVGPLATIGPGVSYYGQSSWHDQVDWHVVR
ncbi:MAG: hypothetical protein QOD24_4457 [Solirubrobacteraceae bacterium]|nr:hypothetical protein [Solirubrobacteraceae bacterium]